MRDAAVRAVVLEEYGRLVMREVEEGKGKGAVVRVLWCGVCGSDVAVFAGKEVMRERWRPPLILGHEVSGVVEEGPAELVGKTVAVNPIISCGRCGFCMERENLCRRRTHIGFQWPGGFAERIRVGGEQLVALPEGTEAWKGALAEPLAVALRAAGLAGPGRGLQALVVGGGGIGALVSWLLVRGGWQVSIAECSERRRGWVQTLGVAREVASAIQGEFDVVVDTVGTSRSVAAYLDRCRPGGKMVVLGLGEPSVRVRLNKLVVEEVQLMGSYTYTTSDFQRAVALLQELPPWEWCTRHVSEAQQVFGELVVGNVACGRVLLFW